MKVNRVLREYFWETRETSASIFLIFGFLLILSHKERTRNLSLLILRISSFLSGQVLSLRTSFMCAINRREYLFVCLVVFALFRDADNNLSFYIRPSFREYVSVIFLISCACDSSVYEMWKL